MLRQTSHSLHGVAVGPLTQLRALAKIRAVEVLPTPRAPVKRYGVTHAMRRDGVGEGLCDVLLPDQLAETLRPVSPRNDNVRGCGLKMRIGTGHGQSVARNPKSEYRIRNKSRTLITEVQNSLDHFDLRI